MLRTYCLAALAVVICLVAVPAVAETTGVYMEARTCQVYTGPCFANAEVGLAGKDAIMAWKIDEGQHEGVDLAGLSVVVVVNATDTLEFRGIDGPREMKSVILIDDKADSDQREALIGFARKHAGRAGQSAVRIDTAPIQMSLDTAELKGQLAAGNEVELKTRKANPKDCICSNESAYYAPLAKVENFAPGVAMEGKFNGRGLGTRWSIPGSRSAYMATFAY